VKSIFPQGASGTQDKLLKITIVLGLAALIYAMIYGRVFQSLMDSAAANKWTHTITNPSAIWILMGTLR
jgi:hypothetical protein